MNTIRKLNVIYVIILCIVSQICFAIELVDLLEVRKINPPDLSSQHLGKEIVAYRPMRKGTPAMKVENIDGKIVVSNYGHGGSGWSLGPGSAKYVVNLMQQDPAAKQITKQTPIAVIGAGAIGLLSAVELMNQGYQNITVIAEQYDNLASHAACGLLAPVSMDNDPKLQKTVDDIGIESYKFYKSIAIKQNKQIPSGTRIIPAYFSTREDSGLEPYVGKVMKPAKDVLVDFQNGTTHKMVAYDEGIFMDTETLMHSLTQALKDSNVKFVHKKINNISEVEQKVVFNCTGNGARELVKDDKMVPVQGHLIMLTGQKPRDMNYMMLVYLNEDKTKNNQDVMRLFYIFPKQAYGAAANDIGVLGGTLIEIPGNKTPNNEEFEIMLNAARRFYGLTNNNASKALETLTAGMKKKSLICYGI